VRSDPIFGTLLGGSGRSFFCCLGWGVAGGLCANATAGTTERTAVRMITLRLQGEPGNLDAINKV